MRWRFPALLSRVPFPERFAMLEEIEYLWESDPVSQINKSPMKLMAKCAVQASGRSDWLGPNQMGSLISDNNQKYRCSFAREQSIQNPSTIRVEKRVLHSSLFFRAPDLIRIFRKVSYNSTEVATPCLHCLIMS